MAFLQVRAGEGVSPKIAATVEEVLLTALDRTGRFRLTGRSDLAALLDLKQRQQMAGCEDNAACVANIAGSLGVDFAATAEVGRLGELTVLTLNVVNVKTGGSAVRARQTVRSDGELIGAADALANEVAATLAPQPAKGNPALKWTGVAALAVGAVAALAGVGVGLKVRADTNDLRTKTRPGDQAAQQLKTTGTAATAANVLMIAGGAVTAGGIALVVAF
jgi:TolB-like protein